MILSTSGSIGDTFLLAVKLKNTECFCRHFTTNLHYKDNISKLYSLSRIPHMFVPERDMGSPRIYTHFNVEDDILLDYEPFPEFFKGKFPHKCILPRSGSVGQNRVIPMHRLNLTEDTCLIGTRVDFHTTCNDLRGKTSFIESLRIAATCESLHAYQGCHVLCALSHKVMTTIYVRDKREEESILSRVHPCWERYIEEIVYV